MASINKRSWATRSGESRSGYEVEWKDASGRRRRKAFSGPKAKKRAEAHKTKVEAIAQGLIAAPVEPAAGDAPPVVVTVKIAADNWITDVKARGRETSTIDKYEDHRDLHIVQAEIVRRDMPGTWRFGDIPLAELTPPDCEALKKVLLAKLTSRNAAKVMTSVRMLLSQAVRDGLCPVNVGRETRVEIIDRGESDVEIPPKDEIKALLSESATEAPAPPTFTEVWVHLGVFAGLRPSELRGLAVEDLVLAGADTGFWVRRKADEYGILGTVKTKQSRRFIRIGKASAALLRRWLLAVPRSSALPDPARKGETIHLLLPTSIGTVQSLANVYNRVWVPLCQDAGLTVPAEREGPETGETIVRQVPRYSLNCLRHIHASLLIDQGMTPKQVQMRMGHSSIKVTYDIYGKLFDKRDADREISATLERDLLS
ncbi:tyrosine-type recombinase/integrase [Mycobacterium sp. KBS0706]|uniref:tyrosine-type recombinase/integrase n=1 Tax=Mycobacterium sp. KBS0706 TaxID=2578109 RepID=UPI00110F8E24|nr:site-specific integrase [Mycobacterium sp. KBS0706]TSD89111.1 tyrosine-type recombinase/integrase [Mycobacterium sp. KBS0706]